MKETLYKRLLATFLPPLLYFILYRGFVYIYTLQNGFWTSKDWGYLIVIVTAIVRASRLLIFASKEDCQYLLRWRTLGYDMLITILAPIILLPIVGFILVIQPKFQLMLICYCCVFIVIKQLFKLSMAIPK